MSLFEKRKISPVDQEMQQELNKKALGCFALACVALIIASLSLWYLKKIQEKEANNPKPVIELLGHQYTHTPENCVKCQEKEENTQ